MRDSTRSRFTLTARLVVETLSALREQSLKPVDPIILKSKLEEHGE
jgi:hypothetical protein